MRRFVLALLLTLATTAAARPGGGQHFSAPSRAVAPSRSYSPSHSYAPTSGYRSSTGGFATDEDGAGPGSFLVMFAVGGAVVAIMLVLLVAAARRGASRRAEVLVDGAAQARGLAHLRERDPGFDAAALSSRAAATMTALNEAWSAGLLRAVRRLLSDGVYVRFQTQLGLLAGAGLRNVTADTRVLRAEIVAAETDACWDAVHLKMVAEGRDADLPAAADATAIQRALAAAPISAYQEVWSFLRRRGRTTTPGAPPALEGKCPSCGARVPPSESVRCDYCQSVLNSGEHDWVLAEITQPEEWRPDEAEVPVAGLDELRARDPMISRQELEDRASVIFWKWIAARVSGDRTKLQRFTLGPLDEQAAGRLWLGAPTPLEKVAVGAAALGGVQPATSPSEPDRVGVRLIWSAATPGQSPRGMGLVLTLARAPGATSRRGFSSLDCPECGGALAESDDPVCRYCGKPLAPGRADWALDHLAEAET